MNGYRAILAEIREVEALCEADRDGLRRAELDGRYNRLIEMLPDAMR